MLHGPFQYYIMLVGNFAKWPPAAILDLTEPEVATFDPPIQPKSIPRIKREVDRVTRFIQTRQRATYIGLLALRNYCLNK